MEIIATITWLALATCVFALIGILGREVERADKAEIEARISRQRPVERGQK